MKTQLKDNIFIEGFDSNEELYNFKNNLCIVGEPLPYIWLGKTSEIPEEIAKECVNKVIDDHGRMDGYENYNSPIILNAPKESIQSACNQTYCIIYKEK